MKKFFTHSLRVFIALAVGLSALLVFKPAMAATSEETYYPDADGVDGRLGSSTSGTWATAMGSAGSASLTDTYVIAGFENLNGSDTLWGNLRVGIVGFKVDPAPTGIITSAKIRTKTQGKATSPSAAWLNYNFGWYDAQPDALPVVDGDWNNGFGSSLVSSQVTYTNIVSAGNWQEWEITDLDYIVPDANGYVWFYLMDERVAGNNKPSQPDPANPGGLYIKFYSYSDGADKPQLVLTVQNNPTVETVSATSITDNTATLNGNLTNLAGESSVSVGFQYDTDGGPVYSYWSPWESKNATGAYDIDITGLSPGTTYHYAAYVFDGSTFYLGDDETFTTTEIVPLVTTDAATSVTNFAAVLNGNVTDFSGDDEVWAWVEWGETTAYGHQETAVVMNATGTFSIPIAGLTWDTEYHYRAKAMNSNGTGFGEDVTFTTTDLVTVGTLDAVAGVGEARLNAELLDLGGNANVTILFDFGSASGDYDIPYYGIRDDGLTPSWIMNTTGEYHQYIYGLTPGETYYYRAHVLGGGQNFYGVEKEVTILYSEINADPIVAPSRVENVTGTSATLKAMVSKIGNYSPIYVDFYYAVDSWPYYHHTGPQTITETGEISADVTDLLPGHVCEFWTITTNGHTMQNGSTNLVSDHLAFSTTGTGVNVYTNDASGIGTTSATIGGRVAGVASDTTPWEMEIMWGTSSTNFTESTGTRSGTGNTTAAWTLTGLATNTQYYYQAWAYVNGQVYTGGVKTFTTAIASGGVPTSTGTPVPVGPVTIPPSWNTILGRYLIIIVAMVLCPVFIMFAFTNKNKFIEALGAILSTIVDAIIFVAAIVAGWIDPMILALILVIAGYIIWKLFFSPKAAQS